MPTYSSTSASRCRPAIAKNGAPIVGATPSRPGQLILISMPLESAYRLSPSMNSSRATTTAIAHRGSSSKFQATAIPEITSSRSTIGSSSAPSRLYWPVSRAANPSR